MCSGFLMPLSYRNLVVSFAGLSACGLTVFQISLILTSIMTLNLNKNALIYSIHYYLAKSGKQRVLILDCS